MKKLLSLLVVGLFSLNLFACGSNNQQPLEETTLTVGATAAPFTIPLLHMMETNALGEQVTINLQQWTDPESAIAMVLDPSIDMVFLPVTVASTLYNREQPIRILNVNVWGNAGLVTSNPDFSSWQDLRNQTIYVPLQGSANDAIVQYFLNAAGLTPGTDVTINYASVAEITQLLVSGQATYAIQTEPQTSAALKQNDALRVAFTLEQAWQEATTSDAMIPNAALTALQPYIDAHPELIARFNEEYAKAIQWTLDNPEQAGALAQEHLGMNGDLVAAALSRMGLKFVSGHDSMDQLNKYFQVLYDFNPNMIGGNLPSSALYYEGQ